MIDGTLKEGDIVLVRFEIRRTEPSDLGCFLACRNMGPFSPKGAAAYEWIPRGEIVCRESEIK